VCGHGHVITEVGAQVAVGAKLALPANGSFEFEFHLGKPQQTGSSTRKKLDKHVKVARRAEVVAEHRPVQREPPDPPAPGEVVEERLLDSQPSLSFTP
jgi:hypothetical protein